MVDFLIGHYTYRMFPPDIDIIPTSLAVVLYFNGRYTNKKSMSHFLLCTHNAPQSSYFRRLSHRSRKLAHQREVVGCLVGTFCEYNVLLGNLPLNYRMFPPAIDRLPKLNLIGGGGELECRACVELLVKVRRFQQPQLEVPGDQCPPPCHVDNGERTHLRTSSPSVHRAHWEEYSCSMPPMLPLLVPHETLS